MSETPRDTKVARQNTALGIRDLRAYDIVFAALALLRRSSPLGNTYRRL
ncbi:MAG: hypothetical protein LUC34_04525 [Campylobacter sp.]|nr:hypothetical protein [Campylobacter sp.]